MLSKTSVWRVIRERKIIRAHKRISTTCEDLIASFRANPIHYPVHPLKSLGTDMIIWQYWAQGYNNVPPLIQTCLQSIEQNAKGFKIVRLSDENIGEYIDIPVFFQKKRPYMSPAHFSDVLRLLLLEAYGGVWADATIKLTGSIPETYLDQEFFVFRRDPAEPNYRYWRNVYAYYFGWAKGFRVNMLNSFIIAQKGNQTISDLSDLMLLWWKEHDDLPDYFFFQILFDVYGCPNCFPLVSDTLPHYLQQSINDPNFHIMSSEMIERTIPIHKLTYK